VNWRRPTLHSWGSSRRTYENLGRIDPGFRHEGVLLIEGDLHRAVSPARIAFYHEILQQVEHLPGVVSTSLAGNTLLSGGWLTDAVGVNGQPPSWTNAHINPIAPHFFETMRTPLVAGRDFTDRDDPGAPPIAIVNDEFVRRYFPDGHPPGQRVTVGRLLDMQIVGVAKDAIGPKFARTTAANRVRPTLPAPERIPNPCRPRNWLSCTIGIGIAPRASTEAA
jgi:MacB-like periplasmic core domain